MAAKITLFVEDMVALFTNSSCEIIC